MIQDSSNRRFEVASADPSIKFVMARGLKEHLDRSEARSGLRVSGGQLLGSRGSVMLLLLVDVMVPTLAVVWKQCNRTIYFKKKKRLIRLLLYLTDVMVMVCKLACKKASEVKFRVELGRHEIPEMVSRCDNHTFLTFHLLFQRFLDCADAVQSTAKRKLLWKHM